MNILLNRTCVVVAACIWPVACWAVDDIKLPDGFKIEEYATVPNARSLALGDNGTVFVSTRRGRTVFAVVADGDGVETIELLAGLNSPNGIAYHDGDLYVAEIDRVTRYTDIESNLREGPEAEVLAIDLPSENHHGWRYIGFGPDGKLYISIGAPCNICEEDGFGQIIRMNADGSEREVFAEGVRNSVGITWHPQTGHLWFTDNGRDMLGDDIPPDELNHASETGQHFGFPYCHAGEILDPRFGPGRDCSNYRPPAQKMGAHVAPLGLKFYTGTMFPSEFQGTLFIAEHGSWNRSKKTGYRIGMVKFENGMPAGVEPFATGWLVNKSVSGRPVDLLILRDGSMLVSDDHAGKLYRISYTEGEMQEQNP